MDYYKILEINENATDEDIKKSYRKLAMKYHPDRNKGDKASEDKFKAISEAYRILSDPKSKQEYDFQRSRGSNHGYFTSGSDFDDYFSGDLHDIINSMWRRHSYEDNWGHHFTSSNKSKYKVKLSFWESVLGTKKTLSVIDQFNQKESFSVAIPPGIEDGTIIPIQIANQTILLHIDVKEDPYFQRKGLDLYTEIELNLSLALLGGTIKLPHWNTTYEVNVPEGVQQGQLLRLTGAGIKTDSKVGDLYLKCKIVTPKKLTKKQKELLNEFKKTEKEKPVISEKKQTWLS